MILAQKTTPTAFSKEFFAEIAKQKRFSRNASLLAGIAKAPEQFERKRQQLEKLFNFLPEAVRNDPNFLAKITNVPNQDTFMGAFGEMATYWVLKSCGLEVQFGAKRGKQTPDLEITNPVAIPVEVFLDKKRLIFPALSRRIC